MLAIVGDQNVAKDVDNTEIFMAFSESGWM